MEYTYKSKTREGQEVTFDPDKIDASFMLYGDLLIEDKDKNKAEIPVLRAEIDSLWTNNEKLKTLSLEKYVDMSPEKQGEYEKEAWKVRVEERWIHQQIGRRLRDADRAEMISLQCGLQRAQTDVDKAQIQAEIEKLSTQIHGRVRRKLVDNEMQEIYDIHGLVRGLRISFVREILEQVLQNPETDLVTSLECQNDFFGGKGIEFFCAAMEVEELERISYLSLECCDMRDDGVMALANAKFLRNLKGLDLRDNFIKREPFEALINSDNLRNLTYLDLRGCLVSTKNGLVKAVQPLRDRGVECRFHGDG